MLHATLYWLMVADIIWKPPPFFLSSARHKPLLLSTWPGVLFLVQLNNFSARLWGYTLLLKLPVLMHSCLNLLTKPKIWRAQKRLFKYLLAMRSMLKKTTSNIVAHIAMRSMLKKTSTIVAHSNMRLRVLHCVTHKPSGVKQEVSSALLLL